MHAPALQLAAILAAEKSKVPFYVAGGALVLWALFVSMALGMRRPNFPGDLVGQRAVVAVTVVLVLGALSTAIVTSSPPAKAGEASTVAQSASSQPAPPPSAPPPSPSSPSTPTSAAAPSTPTSAAAPSTPTAPSPSTPKSSAATSLALAANPTGQLSFDVKQLSAKAGAVTIKLTNTSPVEHNLTIAQGSQVLGATPTFTTGSRSVAVTLKPGTYTFYCSVPGHRAAGMEGTLKVS